MKNEMIYCPHCGTKLIMKPLANEGMVPFCTTCNDYKFQRYNTAVSVIVTNESHDEILLINQYARDKNILVAGYVNPGEAAEHAVVREVKEETGLDVAQLQFNKSEFFEPSSTLMLNFVATVKEQTLHPNNEIDSYNWYSLEEAKENIYRGSIAEKFLLHYLK